MTYTICDPSKRNHFIYDTASGAVIPASELEAYLCEALAPSDGCPVHMPEKCPSEIRYELARFSSTEIGSSYDKLKKLYASGLIFGTADAIYIRSCGDFSADRETIALILGEIGASPDEVIINEQ